MNKYVKLFLSSFFFFFFKIYDIFYRVQTERKHETLNSLHFFPRALYFSFSFFFFSLYGFCSSIAFDTEIDKNLRFETQLGFHSRYIYICIFFFSFARLISDSIDSCSKRSTYFSFFFFFFFFLLTQYQRSIIM